METIKALSPQARADLYLFLVTLMASISWLFSHEALQLMPPLLFLCLRFTMAAVMLGIPGWRTFSTLDKPQWTRSLLTGLLLSVAICFWVLGLSQAAHVGEGAFLVSLATVLVPIMGFIFFKQRPPLSTWIAIPIAALGLYLLTGAAGLTLNTSQLLFLAAALLFAVHYNLNTIAVNDGPVIVVDGITRQRKRIPTLPLTIIAIAMIAIVAGALSFMFERQTWADVEYNNGLLWVWISAGAIVGTAARFLVQTHAQSLSTHSHGVVILLIEPILTTLIAALWLNERMTTSQALGCALIFAAMLTTRWFIIRGAIKALLMRKTEAE